MTMKALRHRGTKAPRRGFALVDVIIGGVMLGIGLAVIISLNSRSLANQLEGERQLTASWIADELLSMVLVVGPADYSKTHDMAGQCEAPFEDFDYELNIDDQGATEPFRVTADVRWNGQGGVRGIRVETFIARRNGDQPESREPDDMIEMRMPKEPVDREKRWLELEGLDEQ